MRTPSATRGALAPIELVAPAARRYGLARWLVLATAAGLVVVGALPVMTFGIQTKTVDLAVFSAGARHVLDGRALYSTGSGALPFIYPPFAALVLVPLSALPARTLSWCWELASVGALVAAVVISFKGLRGKVGVYWPLVVAVISVAMLRTLPLVDELRYGQIDLFIMALVVVDLLAKPRWCPPGVLIGIAAAIKLVPLVFVVLFVLTLQWRTVRNILASFAACTLLALVVVPGDSVAFWLHAMEGTALHWRLGYFTNESIDGMLHRLLPSGYWLVAWVPLAALVAFVGLRGARAAELAGERLAAVALTALVGLLLAPISWVHELVFIVPILGALLGTGSERGRVALALCLWVPFSFLLALPYRGAVIGDSSPLVAGLLEDSLGIILVLLVLGGGSWAVARWGKRSANRFGNEAGASGNRSVELTGQELQLAPLGPP